MKWLICTLVLLATTAQAYIPPTDYIMERTVKNAGKGLFTIEQEVAFRSDTESLLVKEQWLVQDADNMAVTVKGGSLNLQFVYSGGKVYFIENPGSISSRKYSPENIERPFHARSERTLSDLFMSSKILTANPMRPRIRPKLINQIKNEADPFARLARVGEDILIQISASSNPQEAATAPGVWVDQTDYTIKKIRFPSGAELTATQQIELSQDLRFPKVRNLNWDSSSIEIRLLKVNSVTKSADTSRALTTAALSSPLQWGSSTLVNQIRDFYTRFR